MGGQPPVAGLGAVAVAVMLAVGVPAGMAFAEQIRAPVLDGAPKPAKKKQVFRPTMPERNPTRAPDAEALAAAIGEGAQEAAAVAAGSADLAAEASPPPDDTPAAIAETAAPTGGDDADAVATGSVAPDQPETSLEPSTDAVAANAAGDAAATEVAPAEAEAPAEASDETAPAPSPPEATEPPAETAETPSAAPAEQATVVTEVSPPEEPAPAAAAPADASSSTKPAETAETSPTETVEPAIAATAVADTTAKAPGHEVVLEIAPPDTAATTPPPAEPESPTGAAETKDSSPATAEPEVQTAALTPPSEPAPAPATPAEDEKPDSVELEPAPNEAETAPADAEASPDGDRAKPASTSDESPSDVAAEPADAADASPPGDTPPEAEPVPAHPIVAEIRVKLAEPGSRKGTSADDIDALKTFYGAHEGPPLWVTDEGFTEKAHALIEEIGKADDWGLDAGSFELPPANDLLATPNAHADDELQLSLAILSYARDAQIGRLAPSKASRLFDQAPSLRDPKTVLMEIAATEDPTAYLAALHPRHAQFKRLREALQKARAKAEASGTDPDTDRDVQLIVINMERWRWMPRELGAFHVWNNVPEFNARVVKGGKTIYVEKTIVGQFKYATAFFSAPMRTIVFHPDWTVPPTILKEDLAPRLQSDGGFFGNANTAILRAHNLRVSLNGEPVNPESVDWRNVKIWQYTFTQPPGPANVLGQLKFNFPNRHAIYMHDTPQRELFAETVRTLSHGCIRVREPERLAALLLAEDRGWSAAQVNGLLAGGTTNIVKLNRLVPVHLTYFTAVIDEDGQLDTFGDIYGIDNRMAAALFDKPARFPVPATPAVAEAEQPRATRRQASGGGLDELISGLFGN